MMINAFGYKSSNPLYNNWVKCALTLDFAKDAVKEFVETKNKTSHKSLIQKISTACSSCNFNTCATCQIKTCTNKKLKDLIKLSHATQNPSFVNTNPKDCWSHPWEFAKCFMPPNRYLGIQKSVDTDLPGLISVIVNNWDFRETISPTIFIKAKDVCNDIMHNPLFGEDHHSTFKDCTDVISKMLTCIPLTDKTQSSLSKIRKLSSDPLIPTMEDYIRVNNEAMTSISIRKQEIKSSIDEMLELSNRCKHVIKNETATKGVQPLHDELINGLKYIQIMTAEATETLSAKRTTVKCVTKLTEITEACLESLHKETFRTFMRDSEYMSERDLKIRADLSGEIQEVVLELEKIIIEKNKTIGRIEFLVAQFPKPELDLKIRPFVRGRLQTDLQALEYEYIYEQKKVRNRKRYESPEVVQCRRHIGDSISQPDHDTLNYLDLSVKYQADDIYTQKDKRLRIDSRAVLQFQRSKRDSISPPDHDTSNHQDFSVTREEGHDLYYLIYTQTPPQTSNVHGSSSSMQTKIVKEKYKAPSQTYVHDVIEILDTKWKEIFKYKIIRLQPADRDCQELCETIKWNLPKCTFVDVRGKLNIVVVKKRSRVQNDAEMAIEQLGISASDRNDTVLFMFHQVKGSRTKGDVQNVTYTNDTVKQTLHIPYRKRD